MLQLFVYTKYGKKPLELAADGMELITEQLCPYFDYELKGGEFSYPTKVPWTEHNQMVLGSPEMIESVNELLYYTVDVYWNGLPELQEVKLTILEFEGDIDYKNGSYILTISGADSFLGIKLKGKSLKDLTLCGTVNMGMDSRSFANYVMKTAKNQYPFAFAPVRCETYIDTDRADFTTELLKEDTVNNIVQESSLSNGWSFGVTGVPLSLLPVPSGTSGYNNHRTIPFFQLQYVFKRAIEEQGYAVIGDFINDERWRDVYLWNNRSLEIPTSFHTDVNRTIYPPNHMPDTDIATFLAATANLFGFALFVEDNKTVRIKYRKNALRQNEILDITEAIFNEFKSSHTELASDGITIKWNTDGSDQIFNDRVKDISDRALRAVVNFKANLSSITFSPPLSNGDIAYVRSENYYYEYNAAAASWNFYCEGQQSIVIGEGKQELNLDMVPLLQAVASDGYTSNLDFGGMVACYQPGSYYNYNNVLIENDCGLRIFYLKRITPNVNLSNLPVSHNHSYSANYGSMQEVSLSLTASDSIYTTQLKDFIQAQQNTRYVTVTAMADKLPANLRLHQVVQIKNNQFLIVERNRSVGASNLLELKLLRI